MSAVSRPRAWLDRWGPIFPILLAEFIILMGFGALLPVMPLYVQEQGIDAFTLGLIIAGWPIAKLIAEPIFGYRADRRARKPQMLVGLVVFAIATMLPVVFTSAVALFTLRVIGGIGTGMYDPAARSVIVDATPEERRGEAFGIYAAFQMGGFLFGPVVGALGASLGGGYGFPFLFTGILTLLATGLLAVTMPGTARGDREATTAPSDLERHPGATPGTPPGTARDTTPGEVPAGLPAQAPMRDLLNPILLAALVMQFGFQLSFGVYEVVWSLYLTHLGASIELVGLSFMAFAVPSMVVSPFAGRLVDRHGPILYAVLGGGAICVAGFLYMQASEPLFPTLIVPVEGVAESFLMPALFAMVAIGTPRGRSATAQGIFGAVGTVALIVASVTAGALWDRDVTWPFWFFILGGLASLIVGVAIYRRAPRARSSPRPGPSPGAVAEA